MSKAIAFKNKKYYEINSAIKYHAGSGSTDRLR